MFEHSSDEIRSRNQDQLFSFRTKQEFFGEFSAFADEYPEPHEGLKGKTPAEACGIEIEGENKWKTLIENASLSTAKGDAKVRLEDFGT